LEGCDLAWVRLLSKLTPREQLQPEVEVVFYGLDGLLASRYVFFNRFVIDLPKRKVAMTSRTVSR
jgi:hypothetical protein